MTDRLRARGVLHLVVGPSGVGKDALIDRARVARPDILFPRRWITRSADAGGEAHVAVAPEAFEAMAAAGDFALHWRAHGLAYGVPRAMADALGAGRHVVLNASRAAVAQARAQFQPVRVLLVAAPPEALARRIAARGRETEAEARARLDRAPPPPTGPDVRTIDNGGALDDAAAAFLAALAPPVDPEPEAGQSRSRLMEERS
ncbi:MAG: phosphonate metabolism protein/1,5-bisphosphokinase (PRPP-forming) PhnN [Rubrimonas sp.]|uniref:phosphonate metabolism protein/1,5-bisphosphokinase (PRPP-forming) PhnN n=1 Tax=Rubrimonas sp. TaxID=2036015 RepID=UPI002FDF0784